MGRVGRVKKFLRYGGRDWCSSDFIKIGAMQGVGCNKSDNFVIKFCL